MSEGSTTWQYRKVIVRRPAGGQSARGAKRRHFAVLSRWNLRREPLTLKVKYRGGPEAWYEIHARGAILRIPGSIALHDVMTMLCHHD